MHDVAHEIWVVDNASIDGSPAAIRNEFSQVRLIENNQNVGFGAANNQAMKLASGDFFLLVNSDCFLKPGAVRVLLDYLDVHPDVGVVGPRIENTDGSLQLSSFRFQSPLRAWLENLGVSRLYSHDSCLGNYYRWAHNSDRIVDYVIGACMLVRRKAYEEVGGFDEKFFLYAEESDWQRRMTDRSWKVAFTPTALVTHLAGASTPADKSLKRNNFFYRGLDYYHWKYYGYLGLVSYRLATIVGSGLRIALWGVVMICMTERRALALSKVKLYCWLVVRQLTCWELDWREK